MKPLLEVNHLRVHYHTPRGPVKAVDGVHLALQPRERLGLMGESGSGKSTAALSLMRLIKPPGRIESGEVRLDGLDIMSLSPAQMRQVRLAQVALISQGAMNSLNPVMRIRDQIIDGMASHGVRMSPRGWDRRVSELLERVGLRPEVGSGYPHQLSGGMKQRVCIAIAISMEPRVIIADEPTSALDVVVQRRVMETLRAAQEDIGAAVINAFIAAILAESGLSILGLGPQREMTLGMLIYWALNYGAILQNLWWWWATPVVTLICLFLSLYLIHLGFDEVSNPRLRAQG